MRSLQAVLVITASALLVGGADDLPKHDAPATRNGNVVVALCDGKTTIEVKGLKPGQTMGAAQAKSVADELMLA